MASILDSVNQRTQLVGQNRLELLLFKLQGRQRFGINVFKVREVLQCPPLTAMPKLSGLVRGVASIRGKTVSVIDLNMAIGGRPFADISNCFVIIAEYNNSIHGFLVDSVARIVNLNWESVLPPPKGTGRSSYLTAVTEVDNELVEILDVEKILDEVAPFSTRVTNDQINVSDAQHKVPSKLLVVDDSAVARRQIVRALGNLGLDIETVNNGREGLERLQAMAAAGPINEQILLLISDIEMPVMDGYTLTAEIRNDPELSDIHVILHTSLSGVFNNAMVNRVGANDFIPKFNPDHLAEAVQARFDECKRSVAG